MYNIERLRASDYDELLDLLNRAFGFPDQDGFERKLPAMWRRDEESMSKHLAIRSDGAIRSVVGVYPLEVHIAGHKFLFATCGNVCTDAAFRNRGFMNELMTAAADELKAMGAVAARLGGQRQRYERFGFETVGTTVSRTLSIKNHEQGRNSPYVRPRLVFSDIGREDADMLAFAARLQRSEPMYVERGNTRRFYDVMAAWKNVPKLASLPDGTPVGVLSVSPKGIAEQYALTPELKYEMIVSWLYANSCGVVSFVSPGWDHEFNRLADRDCEEPVITGSTQCKILDRERFSNALLDLKYPDGDMPEGDLTVEINGERLLFTGGHCTKTDLRPDLTLNELDAARFLFGCGQPENVCALPREKRDLIRSVFPLPMSWNGQDRV